MISRLFERKKTLIRASLEGLAILYVIYFIANAPYAINDYLETLPNAKLRTLILALRLFFSFGTSNFNNPLHTLFIFALPFAFFVYVKLATGNKTFKQGLKAAPLQLLAELISAEVAPMVGIGVLWSSPISESLPSMLQDALSIIVSSLLYQFLLLNYLSTLVLTFVQRRRDKASQREIISPQSLKN